MLPDYLQRRNVICKWNVWNVESMECGNNVGQPK